jgi:hypothetical protein
MLCLRGTCWRVVTFCMQLEASLILSASCLADSLWCRGILISALGQMQLWGLKVVIHAGCSGVSGAAGATGTAGGSCALVVVRLGVASEELRVAPCRQQQAGGQG